MRTIKQKIIGAVVLFVAVVTAQNVSAYCNPSTGRFLSRDPVGEPGFQLVQGAQGGSQSGTAPVAQQSSRWINRDPIKGLMSTAKTKQGEDGNDYLFVRNDPIRLFDAYGLSVADVANYYWAFMSELKDLCTCHLSRPEWGWMQNCGSCWGCTMQTENLESVFDKVKTENPFEITVNYRPNPCWPLYHNSVLLKPSNPEDPVIDADTWKGCFSVTWPAGSSQKNFKRCFTCKELLK